LAACAYRRAGPHVAQRASLHRTTAKLSTGYCSHLISSRTVRRCERSLPKVVVHIAE
jgi:hypothetical protein